MRTMTVERIENQDDRVLLYSADPGVLSLHVIASPGDDVQVGDYILYDDYGINFGFFEKVIRRPKTIVENY